MHKSSNIFHNETSTFSPAQRLCTLAPELPIFLPSRSHLVRSCWTAAILPPPLTHMDSPHHPSAGLLEHQHLSNVPPDLELPRTEFVGLLGLLHWHLGCANHKSSKTCKIHCLYNSSTPQNRGPSFKDRKPKGDVDCCELWMPQRTH